ncbi:uncharacterized protein [Coffea arabica]|uniref:CCR4-NOT transcription complex subunit 11 n=1 Tax=Coffea arabica TaxID=13443 RepID=A0A6P6TA59_COFAR
MLVIEEAVLEAELLRRGNSRPFDELISEFMSKVQPSHIFDSCAGIAVLLTGNIDLSPTEHLVGFAILHQAYSSQQTSLHPRISLLVEAASNEEAENFERGFILQ